jgi:hypothetical protein
MSDDHAEHGPTDPPPPDSYEVPPEGAAETCPDCGRPFHDAELVALHRGLAHEAVLDDEARERVAAAREAESRRLRLFRLKAIAALVVLYFGLLMVYAVVT